MNSLPSQILNVGRNYSTMTKFLYLLLFVCSTSQSKAQGSWNIGYLVIDSLNQEHIGKVVRLDFKNPKKENLYKNNGTIRSYFATVDTGFLLIDSLVYSFVERRKIYVDHANYKEQYLECLNCKGMTWYIYDSEILSIDSKNILFKIKIHFKSLGFENTELWQIVKVKKKNLDGVFFEL